jgi:hypothetical protein
MLLSFVAIEFLHLDYSSCKGGRIIVSEKRNNKNMIISKGNKAFNNGSFLNEKKILCKVKGSRWGAFPI